MEVGRKVTRGRGVIDLIYIFPQEEATVIARYESGDDDNFTHVGYIHNVI